MALWTPELINPALWLDASDASTITESGGEISQWDDKSNNAYTFSQATAAAKPDNGNTLNSLTTVHFDGGDNLVADQAASTFAWMSDTGPNSFFIVFKPGEVANPNVAYVVFGTGRGSSSVRGFSFHYDDRSSISRNDGTICFLSKGSSTAPIDHYEGNYISTNAFNLVTGQYDPSLSAASRSTVSWAGDTDLTGNASSTAMTAGTPAYALRIGSAGDDGQKLVGEIAEIVFFDEWLDTDTRQKVEGYLAWKWGLEADLATGHPYESAAPQSADTYWDDVFALAKFEDGDGSTTVADEASGTWTVNGATSEVTTDQAKFGTGSFLANSTYAALRLTNAPTLATDDFTIEFWAAPVQAHQAFGRVFQTHNGDVVSGISCTMAGTTENANVSLYSSSNGTTWNVLSGTTILTAPTSDQFYHFCFMRESGTLYVLVDGVQQVSVAYAGTFLQSSDWVFGGQTSTTSRNAGYAFDEIRVTPGVARYDPAGFTVPTESFPINGVAGLTMTLGAAAETDSAVALLYFGEPPVVMALGVAAETDSAMSITTNTGVAMVLGVAEETDTAPAVLTEVGIAMALGVAEETDTALPLGNTTKTFTRYNLYFEEHLDPIKHRGKVVLNRALTTGEHLEIHRRTPRYTNYEAEAQTPVLVEQFEYALDKLCFIQQELEEHACACPTYSTYSGTPLVQDDEDDLTYIGDTI